MTLRNSGFIFSLYSLILSKAHSKVSTWYKIDKDLRLHPQKAEVNLCFLNGRKTLHVIWVSTLFAHLDTLSSSEFLLPRHGRVFCLPSLHPVAFITSSGIFRIPHLPCNFSFFLSLLYLQHSYSLNMFTRLCISVLFCSCLRNSLSLSLLRRAPYSWELVLVFGSSHPSLTSAYLCHLCLGFAISCLLYRTRQL